MLIGPKKLRAGSLEAIKIMNILILLYTLSYKHNPKKGAKWGPGNKESETMDLSILLLIVSLHIVRTFKLTIKGCPKIPQYFMTLSQKVGK